MSMPISHIMLAKVVRCEEITTLRKIVELLRVENAGSVLVVHGEQSVGIVTVNDVLGAIVDGRDLDTTQARDIMSRPIVTIAQDTSLEDALREFERTGHTRLVVMSGSKVAGMLKKSVAERFKGLTGLYAFTPASQSLPFRHGRSSTKS
jgi:CBS domain-containing protein